MIPRITFVLTLALACACSSRADEPFWKKLTPAEFEAAGLQKLTPEELANLDAVVHGQQVGAVSKAKEETAKAVTASVRQQVLAEDKKAASPGFMDRMKVMLKPGTEIEYTTLDAELLPPFNGWQKGTVFNLSNGQRWVATDNDSYWAPLTHKPVRVQIIPGSMGSFFMVIEGGGRPRVKFLGSSTPVPAER